MSADIVRCEPGSRLEAEARLRQLPTGEPSTPELALCEARVKAFRPRRSACDIHDAKIENLGVRVPASSARASCPVRAPRVRTRGPERRAGGFEERAQAALPVLRHAQPRLGAPPQDVLGGAGPLASDEVLDLHRMEPGSEVLAEVAGAVAPGEEPVEIGSVVTHVVPEERLRKPSVAREG